MKWRDSGWSRSFIPSVLYRPPTLARNGLPPSIDVLAAPRRRVPRASTSRSSSSWGSTRRPARSSDRFPITAGLTGVDAFLCPKWVPHHVAAGSRARDHGSDRSPALLASASPPDRTRVATCCSLRRPAIRHASPLVGVAVGRYDHGRFVRGAALGERHGARASEVVPLDVVGPPV